MKHALLVTLCIIFVSLSACMPAHQKGEARATGIGDREPTQKEIHQMNEYFQMALGCTAYGIEHLSQKFPPQTLDEVLLMAESSAPYCYNYIDEARDYLLQQGFSASYGQKYHSYTIKKLPREAVSAWLSLTEKP